jgi:TrfA protein
MGREKRKMEAQDPARNQSPKIRDIQQRCQRMAEITREREANEIVQLPLWSEQKRGTPNSFIRSALFAAIQSKDRVYLEDAVLASQQGITVKFTGKQLNQEDLTVWETLVHLARQHPLGHVCSFTAYGILKEMELNTGGDEHKRLHSSIGRLTACAVYITHEGRTYFGSLIEGGTQHETNQQYTIRLNRDLIQLFGDNQWTAIEWQQRLKLRRKPLAQALHAYFSSHQKPYPVKLSTLQEITGSQNPQPASFKRQCRTALDGLIKIGFLESYSIEGDLVTVNRILPPQLKSK